MNHLGKAIFTLIFAAVIVWTGNLANAMTVSEPAESTQKVEMDNESEKELKPHSGSEEQYDRRKDAGEHSSGNAQTIPEPAKQEVAQVPAASSPAPQNNTGDVQSLIRQYTARYGVDSGLGERIAHCESTTGRNLINKGYTAPDGSHPTGVYQFTLETWYDLARQRGWPAIDERLNTEKNIDMFAWAYANGNAWRWECK